MSWSARPERLRKIYAYPHDLNSETAPDAEGRITVFGMDVTEQSQIMAIKRVINRVSVDAAFFKKLSAMENLLYTARLYAIDEDQGMRKAREILDQLGFDAENLDSSMEQLSRGQQQKVAMKQGHSLHRCDSCCWIVLNALSARDITKSKKEVAAFTNRLREEQGHNTVSYHARYGVKWRTSQR